MNPFEDPDAEYLTLVNDEGQHCLWPAPLEVPDGWEVVHGPDSRAACVAYVEEHWVDLRPASVRERMAEAGQRS